MDIPHRFISPGEHARELMISTGTFSIEEALKKVGKVQADMFLLQQEILRLQETKLKSFGK